MFGLRQTTFGKASGVKDRDVSKGYLSQRLSFQAFRGQLSCDPAGAVLDSCTIAEIVLINAFRTLRDECVDPVRGASPNDKADEHPFRKQKNLEILSVASTGA